ncbi:electroneutral sodium bicarbonate exchanger 1-like [Pogoniulus pusillus]|uniref:electroneutral sodium bicarbonate exchanger 1-like n=1 Tax=Pogoniulus pusillus TaxID=488313 RepID=UPI0030B929DF
MAGSSFSYLSTEGRCTSDSFNCQVSQRASEQMLQELLKEKEKEEKEETTQDSSKQLRRAERGNARLQKRLEELEKAHLQETSSHHPEREPQEVQRQATATVCAGTQTPLLMWASCSGKEQQTTESQLQAELDDALGKLLLAEVAAKLHQREKEELQEDHCRLQAAHEELQQLVAELQQRLPRCGQSHCRAALCLEESEQQWLDMVREENLQHEHTQAQLSPTPAPEARMDENGGDQMASLKELLQGYDEEAVIDQGKWCSTASVRYENELEEHRTQDVGRRQLVRRSRSRSRDRRCRCSHQSPSQRVQAILASEEDKQHVAHKVFSHLAEIYLAEGGGAVWKEAARWLKFEEDVEDGGERWSKPYVGTLPLPSLLELKSFITSGTVLLDISASSMEEIADAILQQQGQLTGPEEQARARVREVLLMQHQHQKKKERSFWLPKAVAPAQRLSPQPAPGAAEAEGVPKQESAAMALSKAEQRLLKRIPVAAEACSVLVAELDSLQQPVVAFVRLAQAVLLPGLTQVPVPTRFLFVLLGPAGKAQQYHEVGRCMATLMTDEVFQAVAYKGKGRGDLVAGIEEFLEQVKVLPAGQWDPSIRIEPPEKVPLQEHRKTPGAVDGSALPSQPGRHTGPELEWTGRLCGGLIRDVKCRALWYWSDFRDALSLQCLASFLFLYCACMSPVITFGGLLGEATEGHIGAMESLLGACLSGVLYCLFAGQPLTILGSTGPVLVFEKIIYQFCKDHSLSYLSLRACIGLWTSFFCMVLVVTDASCLVRYITRFTEETYASLICLIFIYEALEKLLQLQVTYPVHTPSTLDSLTTYSCKCVAPTHASNETLRFWESNQINVSGIAWHNLTVTECRRLHGEFQGAACGRHGPYTPNVFLWCCILLFSTFILASILKNLRTSRFFTTKVRSTISDFAVFLTVAVMVLTDFLAGIPSPKLHVPSTLKLSRDDRGWFISPLGPNPWWTVLAALIPALICTILVFMDQHITVAIVNRKDHKLKKGCGYHLDLFMVAVLLGVCSLMGLPWFVAATVLSITHVNSLKVECEGSAPGEQVTFQGVREQRVTGLMVFVLMGCSVFLTQALQLIPMPVLYGIFLYMGVSSLQGLEFFRRLQLLCMPAKHQPDCIYLRHVPLRKVHLFTLIQSICLVLLWAIKMTPAAIIFPMLDLALILVRRAMEFCFSKRELSLLDDLLPESRKKMDSAKNEGQEEEQ